MSPEWTDVLLSGNHAQIARWRRKQQILRTKKRRKDLYEKFIEQELSKEDKVLLQEIESEEA